MWSLSLLPPCEALRICRAFRSQQNGAVARMWRLCHVKPSQYECAIGVVRCQKEGCCCNHSTGVALKCTVHHEPNVCKEQYHIYVAWTSSNRVISSGELYCCLLPQCEALRICCSDFLIATISDWIQAANRFINLGRQPDLDCVNGKALHNLCHKMKHLHSVSSGRHGRAFRVLAPCSSHTSTTATCKQSRSKQGEEKDQASDT